MKGYRGILKGITYLAKKERCGYEKRMRLIYSVIREGENEGNVGIDELKGLWSKHNKMYLPLDIRNSVVGRLSNTLERTDNRIKISMQEKEASRLIRKLRKEKDSN